MINKDVYSAYRLCLNITALYLCSYWQQKYPCNQLTMDAANAIKALFGFFA